MITKIKIQITIVTDCDESCICLKKNCQCKYMDLNYSNNLYSSSLTMFIILFSLQIICTITYIIQHFDTNQINSLVILFVCQVMLPNCACIIYWSRQISHLCGVLEANNEIDSQRLNVEMNPRHAL